MMNAPKGKGFAKRQRMNYHHPPTANKRPKPQSALGPLASVLRWSLVLAPLPAPPQTPDNVKPPPYDPKYYPIHPDLTRDSPREAQLRMTKMAEEYRARTKMF